MNSDFWSFKQISSKESIQIRDKAFTEYEESLKYLNNRQDRKSKEYQLQHKQLILDFARKDLAANPLNIRWLLTWIMSRLALLVLALSIKELFLVNYI